nr:hypothetical protein [Tanacetum cinerariifolium]
MTLEGKKTWWLRLGAEVYDSWKLKGDVEELWDELAKLGLGLRCCLVSMVPRLKQKTKGRCCLICGQEMELRCLCATYRQSSMVMETLQVKDTGCSISSDGFLPFILMVVVIMVMVIIVAVDLEIVVAVIVRVVIVVTGFEAITFPSILLGNPLIKTSMSFSEFGTMFGHKSANSWNLLMKRMDASYVLCSVLFRFS